MSPDEPWYVRRFDATYLETYGHRDAAEAEAAVQHLLVPLGLGGRRVLDLACGAGRHVRELERHGARAAGVDLSAPLLQAARAAGIRASLGWARADMRRLPFVDASFDIVISMFTSFGYFDSADQDRIVLREVGRVTAAGGTFVLDVLNAARVRRALEPETRRRIGDCEVHERRRLEAQDIVVKEIELRRGNEVHRHRERVRLWDGAPLSRALAACGFDVVHTWGGYRGEVFDAGASERRIVRARRRAGARAILAPEDA